MKLLLVDNEDRVLLIHAKDPQTHAECWYPVGGGVEPGESLQTAAAREAYEETGLVDLPTGVPVWRRDHRYEFDGQAFDVHEEWLLHRVERFEPAPAQLSDFETRTILGFRWWRPKELADTTETIFPLQGRAARGSCVVGPETCAVPALCTSRHLGRRTPLGRPAPVHPDRFTGGSPGGFAALRRDLHHRPGSAPSSR